MSCILEEAGTSIRVAVDTAVRAVGDVGAGRWGLQKVLGPSATPGCMRACTWPGARRPLAAACDLDSGAVRVRAPRWVGAHLGVRRVEESARAAVRLGSRPGGEGL